MNTAFTLAATVAARDSASPVVDKIKNHFGALKNSIASIDPELKNFQSGMKSIESGVKTMAVGTGGLLLSKSFLDARLQVTQFESDIQSLGISASGVQKISLAADQAGVSLGVTKENFLKAAYDIKSGLSSLSDEGVAEYTKLVAVTAAATKGDTAQLASYFGSVSNIFRATYKDMSDADLGRMIANMSASSVQMYKVDGPKLQAAMESVSSSAASAGMKMDEQMAILGRLSNKMGGGEAGTALRSFVQNAASAGEKLGLGFTNSEGKLKSTAEIIDLISNRFGDLQKTAAQTAIKDAFGTDEAVKLVQNLAANTSDLRNEIVLIGESGKAIAGTGAAFDMAGKRVDNASADISKLSSGWNALKESMGKPLENVFGPIAEGAAKLAGAVSGFLNEHQKIAGTIGTIIVLGSTIAFLYGAYKTVRGAAALYSLAQAAVAGSAAPATGSLTGLTGAIIANTSAWLANPITWVVIAILLQAGAIYYLVTHWDNLKQRFKEAPVWLKIVVGYVLYMLGPISWLTIGILVLRDHWDGLKAKAVAVTSAIHDVWQKIPAPIRAVLGVMSVLRFGIGGIVLLIIGEWDHLKKYITGAIDFFADRLGEVKKFLGFGDEEKKDSNKAYASGKKFGETYAAGIRSSRKDVEYATENLTGAITPYMNQSDAKKGPLAKTSSFGKSFVKTWGAGVEEETSRTPVPKQFAEVQAKSLNTESSPAIKGLSGKSGDAAAGMMVQAKSLANIILNLNGQDLSLERLSSLLAEAILMDLEKNGYPTGGVNA